MSVSRALVTGESSPHMRETRRRELAKPKGVGFPEVRARRKPTPVACTCPRIGALAPPCDFFSPKETAVVLTLLL